MKFLLQFGDQEVYIEDLDEVGPVAVALAVRRAGYQNVMLFRESASLFAGGACWESIELPAPISPAFACN